MFRSFESSFVKSTKKKNLLYLARNKSHSDCFSSFHDMFSMAYWAFFNLRASSVQNLGQRFGHFCDCIAQNHCETLWLFLLSTSVPKLDSNYLSTSRIWVRHSNKQKYTKYSYILWNENGKSDKKLFLRILKYSRLKIAIFRVLKFAKM